MKTDEGPGDLRCVWACAYASAFVSLMVPLKAHWWQPQRMGVQTRYPPAVCAQLAKMVADDAQRLYMEQS